MLDKKQWAIAENALRRASYTWAPRRKVKLAAKRSEGEFANNIPGDRSRDKYECAMCGLLFRNKEINLDHVNPVVPIEGTEDLNELAVRMLCYEDGWQVLCKSCHKDKSNEENEQRRKHKKGN